MVYPLKMVKRFANRVCMLLALIDIDMLPQRTALRDVSNLFIFLFLFFICFNFIVSFILFYFDFITMTKCKGPHHDFDDFTTLRLHDLRSRSPRLGDLEGRFAIQAGELLVAHHEHSHKLKRKNHGWGGG